MRCLSPSECDLLALITAGLDDDAIAAEVGLPARIVGVRITRLYRRLGIPRDRRIDRRVCAALIGIGVEPRALWVQRHRAGDGGPAARGRVDP